MRMGEWLLGECEYRVPVEIGSRLHRLLRTEWRLCVILQPYTLLSDSTDIETRLEPPVLPSPSLRSQELHSNSPPLPIPPCGTATLPALRMPQSRFPSACLSSHAGKPHAWTIISRPPCHLRPTLQTTSYDKVSLRTRFRVSPGMTADETNNVVRLWFCPSV
ncbi:hypothetical protein T440DRAFT_217664 [Plenodomus tracheiphilus IPT5]|uniref:Uncharacterized protein n=1 Tax=Plenodomus tracheiphilus IPT5 TaxID=1408161 RepID=A0A6A7AUE0_9PLEO|nr:hypothetical protein T440DRAFT_217664 [Plenodomus tracheiphilus IPT5]